MLAEPLAGSRSTRCLRPAALAVRHANSLKLRAADVVAENASPPDDFADVEPAAHFNEDDGLGTRLPRGISQRRGVGVSKPLAVTVGRRAEATNPHPPHPTPTAQPTSRRHPHKDGAARRLCGFDIGAQTKPGGRPGQAPHSGQRRARAPQPIGTRLDRTLLTSATVFPAMLVNWPGRPWKPALMAGRSLGCDTQRAPPQQSK